MGHVYYCRLTRRYHHLTTIKAYNANVNIARQYICDLYIFIDGVSKKLAPLAPFHHGIEVDERCIVLK